MKKLFTILILLTLMVSCDSVRYIPNSYYYDYNPYPNYYYTPYPYGYSYGFGIGWEYGPHYYNRHYFYKQPQLPKNYNKVTPPARVKQENRNVQQYKRPSGNIKPTPPRRETGTNVKSTTPTRNPSSNSGRRK